MSHSADMYNLIAEALTNIKIPCEKSVLFSSGEVIIRI